jgi:outer membrane protein assembly factor BamB
MKDTVTPDLHSDHQRETLHAIITSKSVIRSSEARILDPNGRRQTWLIDLRTTFCDPLALQILASQFWACHADRLPFQVGGLELGAVPLIAAIQLEGLRRGVAVNGFIIRRERKSYGLTKNYEGQLTNDPIIAVDDTFNSGNSAEKVRVVLADQGHSVRELFVVIDYKSERGDSWAKRHDVRLTAIFELSDFGISLTKSPSTLKQTEFQAAWSFTLSGGHYGDVTPTSTPALDNQRLYVGSDDGHLWALDKRNGGPIWKFGINGSNKMRIRSSPVVFEGNIYFGSYNGDVYCINADSGRELWRFSDAEFVESSPSLAIELNMLFIGLIHLTPGRQGSIVALQLHTGRRLWEFSVECGVRATPTFDSRSRLLACGTDDGELLLFDPVARNLLWRFACNGPIRAAAAFDSTRSAILVSALDGSLHSISVSTGKARWSAKTDGALHSTPLVLNDGVYVTSTDKHLYVLNADTGKLLRRIPTRGRLYASPRLYEGRVYLGATSGLVYEIDPVNRAITGQVQLPEPIADAIVHDGVTGLLYARSYDGKIYSFRRNITIGTH